MGNEMLDQIFGMMGVDVKPDEKAAENSEEEKQMGASIGEEIADCL